MSVEEFPVYKGLQRPLVFKSFKGRFIYWALGSVLAGILIGGVVSATINSIVGIILMIIIGLSGLGYTLNKQKKGLYVKRTDNAIIVMKPKYRIKNEKTKF